MKSINIVGAFDRYNYGDLLFPILIEEYLKSYRKEILDNYKLEYYALIESNLKEAKGKKTLPLKNLYEKNLDEGSVIIISGGDVLPARIGNMDIDLCSSNIETIKQKIKRKLYGIEKFEKGSKLKFGINSEFPWVISEVDFTGCKVAYNAVGGSTINNLLAEEIKFIKNNIKDSSYISVREDATRNNLSEFNVQISPDSAVIMSELYPIKKLECLVSDRVREYGKRNYIAIQSNNASVKKGKDKVLAGEINRIKKEYDVDILMLPIGFAANHDDNIAIKKISKHLDGEYEYFEFLNIYEVMYLIANAKFFAGTSLHGNITASSYAVHHIGLNKSIKKLDKYLKYWDIDGQNRCIDFEELSKEYTKIISLEPKLLENKRNELIDQVKGNYKNMFISLGVN